MRHLAGAKAFYWGTLTESLEFSVKFWFQFCKGLAEYRRGNFVGATEQLQSVTAAAGAEPYRDVIAFSVLAMAEHQTKQTEEARAVLAKGIALAETKLPKFESGDIGTGWNDWIVAQVFLREAKAMIDPPFAK